MSPISVDWSADKSGRNFYLIWFKNFAEPMMVNSLHESSQTSIKTLDFLTLMACRDHITNQCNFIWLSTDVYNKFDLRHIKKTWKRYTNWSIILKRSSCLYYLTTVFCHMRQLKSSITRLHSQLFYLIGPSIGNYFIFSAYSNRSIQTQNNIFTTLIPMTN